MYQRVKLSWIARVRACPMCKVPVTLGGGKGMTNGSALLLADALEGTLYSGLKNPWACHQSYHADSIARGLYPAAIGFDRSFFL